MYLTLEPGDQIEIEYKLSSDGTAVQHRWYAAVVISRDEDCRPIARLHDGQITEIRAFMNWRLVRAAVWLAA